MRRVDNVKHNHRNIGKRDIATNGLNSELIDEEARHFQIHAPRTDHCNCELRFVEHRIEPQSRGIQFRNNRYVGARIEEEVRIVKRLAVISDAYAQEVRGSCLSTGRNQNGWHLGILSERIAVKDVLKVEDVGG